MAEWFGHLMNGWPTWAIGVGAIIIFIIGIFVVWASEAAWGDITIPSLTRRKNAKK